MSRSGKSTLINVILKNELAKTAVRYPVTPSNSFYEDENLKLLDTRGIDGDSEEIKNHVIALQDEILQLIRNEFNTTKPEIFIDCFWYCHSSSKLFPEELQIIKYLKNSFKDIPLIFVHTMSIPKNNDLVILENFIKKECPYDIKFINVLAKKN